MIIKPCPCQAIGTRVPLHRHSGGVSELRNTRLLKQRVIATLTRVCLLGAVALAHAQVLPAAADTSTSTAADALAAALAVPYLDTADEQIKIDGVADESQWQQVQPFDNLTVIEPDSLAQPRYRTLTRMFYSPRGLYVSV